MNDMKGQTALVTGGFLVLTRKRQRLPPRRMGLGELRIAFDRAPARLQAAKAAAAGNGVIASPAFEMQYSPRAIDTSTALLDETVTMERGGSPSPAGCSSIQRAILCVRKKGPRRLMVMQRS